MSYYIDSIRDKSIEELKYFLKENELELDGLLEEIEDIESTIFDIKELIAEKEKQQQEEHEAWKNYVDPNQLELFGNN